MNKNEDTGGGDHHAVCVCFRLTNQLTIVTKFMKLAHTIILCSVLQLSELLTLVTGPWNYI